MTAPLSSMVQAEIPQLENFSRSIRGVSAHVEHGGTTVGLIADALIRSHPQYGVAPLLGQLDRAGQVRPLAAWLDDIAGLLDVEAVRRSRSQVIDGRLALLALARLDSSLDALLRASRLRWRLERDLGYPLADVFRPWALPARATELVDLWTDPEGAATTFAFSPDGRVLATADERRGLVLFDAASGALRAVADEEPVTHVAFHPAGRLLATLTPEGDVTLRDAADGRPRLALRTGATRLEHEPPDPHDKLAFSPDGETIAILGSATVQLVATFSGEPRATLGDKRGPASVRAVAFSPDGRRIAGAGASGILWLWDVTGGRGGTWAREDPLDHVAFSPDGALVASAAASGMVRLTDAETGNATADLDGHDGALHALAFSPDGSLLATCGADGYTRVWDVAGAEQLRTLKGGDALACAWTADGRRLATGHREGALIVWDLAGRRELQTVVHGAPVREVAAGPDGSLVATRAGDGRVRVLEEVSTPGLLPAIVPDTVGDEDLLDVAADADALANVIAATATAPPLSIGLFGDWGSGKSFLVGQIQERVRRLSLRSRRTEATAYCRYVRNVEFNAWHYADANLWASLVTHVFDELAKPEPAAGVTDEATARAQLARLEEQLAAGSALRERAERAQRHAASVAVRKRLLRWTWGLAGVDAASLGEVGAQLHSVRGTVRLALPTARARLSVGLAALVLGAAAVAVVLLAGADAFIALVAAIATTLGSLGGWLALANKRIAALLERAGAGTRTEDLSSATIDAELAAARDAERELGRELADLASGRRLARFAAERGAAEDYRAQLGLVSRIHDDFVRMSDILRAQAQTRAPAAAPGSRAVGDDLPQIDRIVLYIDDLDRCPPRRVVEVLEAVHLILAVPLFVVVIAVDPRWLLQSLRLHYAELLGAGSASARAAAAGDPQDEDEEAWRSGPLHYLEKIIQMPFALRPMKPGGVRSLVTGLLPLERPAGAEPAMTASAAGAASAARPDAGTQVGGAPAPPPPRARRTGAPRGTPSLSPRTLALTADEREFAVRVAAVLPTPRTVKKFTNLYRLLRAGLDEHGGELDRLLADDGLDAPEYQAVLVLLAAIIAFPDEASDALLCLGDLAPDAPPDARSWASYVEQLRAKDERLAELAAFFERVAPATGDGGSDVADGDARPQPWTREPFRRWALEVSRYSFATGQEVFARALGGC